MNKKLSKNGRMVVMAFAAILIIILVVVIGLVVKKSDKKDNNGKKTTATVVDNSPVIDGDFDAKPKGNSYVDFFKNEHKFDIHVPVLRYENATEVNEEIEKLYNSFVKIYNECYSLAKNTNVLNSEKLACSIEVNYSTAVVDDVVSVLIYKKYEDNLDVYNTDYYTFNFDTKTGKLLSYSDILNKYGYSNEGISAKIMETYKEFVDDNKTSYSEEDYAKTNAGSLGENIIYITSDGKLGVICKFYISALSSKPLLPVVSIG